MKPNKTIVVVSLVNALTFCLTPAFADTGRGDKGSQPGAQAKSHMSSKGAVNTNAQWSADPEKGWVRAEERRQRHEESNDKSAVKKNSGKHTAKGKKEKNNEQKPK